MYNPLVISNFFINKSLETGIELTPMKLLKLVYISHGWFMGYNDDPLISDAVLAWEHGPVIRKVYDRFKVYGRNQITSLTDINFDGTFEDAEIGPTDSKVKSFLELIWKKYHQYDGLTLSALTHKAGSPWARTIKIYGRNSIIPNEFIREYYKKLTKEHVN